MNRRKFALSWGRKVFFGISWPMTMVLGLIYLRSFILPESATEWIYFIANYFGHYGVMNALVYFLLFCPVVLIMPTYYISRFWSLFLVMALNIFVLIDGVTFSSYHFHIYSFLHQIFLEQGPGFVFGSSFSIVIGGLAVVALLIWLRGEKIWRYMQRRFNNEVDNWYLVLILLTFGLGQALLRTSIHQSKVSELFPIGQEFLTNGEVTVSQDNRRFHYPKESPVCTTNWTPNFIMIVVESWNKNQLTEELMPNVTHMKSHAGYFTSHSSASSKAQDGMFALQYSIPSSYHSSVSTVLPAWKTEAQKKGYEMVEFGLGQDTDAQVMEKFRQWSQIKKEAPVALTIVLKDSPQSVDQSIQEIVGSLQKNKLLSYSYMIMTGAHSGAGSELNQVPLLVFQSHKNIGEFSHHTSHYDVIPSAMEKMWNCKKAFKVASIGYPLSEANREWLLMSGDKEFKVVDFKNHMMTHVHNNSMNDLGIEGKSGEPNRELVMRALKVMTDFSRPR